MNPINTLQLNMSKRYGVGNPPKNPYRSPNAPSASSSEQKVSKLRAQARSYKPHELRMLAHGYVRTFCADVTNDIPLELIEMLSHWLPTTFDLWRWPLLHDHTLYKDYELRALTDGYVRTCSADIPSELIET